MSGKCEPSTISVYGLEKEDKVSNLVHVKQFNPANGLEVVKEEDNWSLNFWHKGQEGGKILWLCHGIQTVVIFLNPDKGVFLLLSTSAHGHFYNLK